MEDWIDKDSPEHMIIGEIIRLIDLVDDEKKLGIIYKYAEVAFSMNTVDKLAKKLNSEDKDNSYEKFKKMTKEFVERL